MKYEVGEYYETESGSILKLIKKDCTALWFKRVYGQDHFVCAYEGVIGIILDTNHHFKKLSDRNKKVLEVLYGN